MVIKWAWLDVTSESFLQVSSQRLSVGMTPKTLRLPKPGEMLLSVHGSPLGVYKEDNMEAIHGMKSIYIFSCSCCQHCIEGACLLYWFYFFYFFYFFFNISSLLYSYCWESGIPNSPYCFTSSTVMEICCPYKCELNGLILCIIGEQCVLKLWLLS